MKKIILMFIAMVMTFGISNATAATQGPQPQSKAKIEKVVLSVDLVKPDDAKKIETQLPKQKGVKSVVVDKKAERVTVTYDGAQTSEGALIKDLSKLGVKSRKFVEPKKK